MCLLGRKRVGKTFGRSEEKIVNVMGVEAEMTDDHW
jgi:hypothetical protein